MRRMEEERIPKMMLNIEVGGRRPRDRGRRERRILATMLNTEVLKALLKTLNEPDPTVRDNAAEALGTAMKAVGEKAIMPFMTDLDNSKLTKIKECCEKAVMLPVKRPTTSRIESLAVMTPARKKVYRAVQEKACIKRAEAVQPVMCLIFAMETGSS
uniref:Uncharacterized protein n=1 Tax=Timema genevievae TaxID=629358 RepID=A0A7R9PNH5_TIMGE|nr:unnamed protein product [Timema genevievae]